MFQQVKNKIRARTRREWQAFFNEKLVVLRIFAQENGEKVFILGVVAGIAIVLFFKVVALLIALVLLAYFVVLAVAE